jgi:hypothetical protein
MTTKSITSVTDGQKKQVRRFAEDALDRAIAEGVLDKDSIQKLIENGDDFQERILAAVRELSLSNLFADEETESSYGYLSGYKPKGMTEQTNRLRQLIPGIGFANEKLVEQPLPPNAEGYFAISRWQSVAPTYGQALQKMFDLIKQTRDGKFYDYREGKLGADRLRLVPKTQKALEKLGKEQEGFDILVAPCQFGFRHRGRSVRRAREVFMATEFGLDPFSIACMILTHEDRLKHYDDLWIDCAGADYDFDGFGSWDDAPFFSFGDDEVEFGTRFLGHYGDRYGSASAVLPQ